MKYVSIALFMILGCATKPKDAPIILINIEQVIGDKKNLAKGISILNSFNPKVMGIDFLLSEEKNEAEFISVLEDCENLVMGTEIDGYEERLEEYSKFSSTILSPILETGKCTGFRSLIEEEDAFFTVKRFSSWEKVNRKVEYQFGVRTAMLFDSTKVSNFVKKHSKINEIDFHDGKKFKTFELGDLINGKVKKADVEGKIVLLGFLGPGFTDRFYSGAIRRGNGSFVPDMYLAEFHAHIIMQALSE